MLSLLRSLRLSESPCIAFVGAGGKTTAIFSLAYQMHSPVLVTATTHFGSWEKSLAEKIIIIDDKLPVIKTDIEKPSGVTLIIGPEGENNRHIGLSEGMIYEAINSWKCDKPSVLIEADGSRKRPLKAPAQYEPAIPKYVDMVLVVAGMQALWMPLSESHVHRAGQFSKLSGLPLGARITPEAIIKVLEHPSGGLKNIPAKTRISLLLNQTEDTIFREAAEYIARELLTSYERVLVGALNPEGDPERDIRNLQTPGANGLELPAVQQIERDQIYSCHERIGAIILAAGSSRRFGQPKQLLDWNGMPLIRHVVSNVLDSELKEVLVITGAYANEVSRAIEDLPVVIIHNPGWQEGQSSSIRTGLENIGKDIGGVLFILADQPFLTKDLINNLVDHHKSTLAPIIAPYVNHQRSNPVLFDRRTFADLGELTGNQGGRFIFTRHNVDYVLWDDPRILIDIDTNDDYLTLGKSIDG